MTARRDFLRGGALAAGLATIGGSARARNAASGACGVPGYSYRLPNFAKGSRLLFQGDSITDMKWGRNQKDRNHYLGHSYVYLIASRLGVDMPEAELDIYNRGISGNKVGDLRARWQKDAVEMKPDLLSILVGVNDVGRNGADIENGQWEADYRFILDASRAANADLKLVLLDPFVLPSGRFTDAEMFKKWRGLVDWLLPIVAKLAEDYDAVHVRTQDVFTETAEAAPPEQWIWDGVHPLPQGHELIARQWLHDVSARWG